MITVTVNTPDFEYDIHSLVKAFYPEEDVVVGEHPEEKKKGPIALSFHVYYETGRIRVQMEKPQAGESLPGSESTLAEESRQPVEPQGEGLPQDEVRQEDDDSHPGVLTLERQAQVDYEGKKDPAKRRETKNRLKKLLYGMLQEETGKTLPWGTLSGIRPTKIPMKGLEEGKTEEEILEGMKEDYLVSEEKGRLSIRIAEKEKAILDRLHPKEDMSLYVDVPFCPTRCLYCSFTSYPIGECRKRHLVSAYLDALEKEVHYAAGVLKGKKLETVYIGGGTPTSLSEEELERLLSMLEENLDFSSLLEFTVEGGRPDSFTKGKLQVLKQHPVTRISVNPQTMNQKTLEVIGRAHTVQQTIDAFHLARSEGFDNINMDIILGLPGEGENEVRHTLEEVEKLRPDSLTVHSLAIKRAARLSEEYDEYRKLGMENNNRRMRLAQEAAEKMGLSPYYLYRQKNMAGNLENTGYARPGKEGIYNILIMEEKQTILSLGAGGMTKVVREGKPVRVHNVKDVQQYISRVDEMIERKKEVLDGIE